jgi:hypothetical protein
LYVRNDITEKLKTKKMGTKINDLTMDCGNDYRGEFRQDYENYMRDYINPMNVKIRNTDNILKVKNYPFLEPIKKIQTKIIMFLMLVGIGFLSMSCDKDKQYEPPTQNEQMIMQSFSLEIPVKEIPMTKGTFIPGDWVHPFSDVKFELKITNAFNTYTRMVSVNELRAGTINIQMIPGTYDITYTPTHSPKFAVVLDIGVNMTNVVVNGAGIITMQGILLDALVIIDIPGIERINYNYPALAGFVHDAKGFWWAYTNVSFIDLDLYFGSSGGDKMFSISPLSLGIVYWVQSTTGQTIYLNIPSMTYQTIIFN